MSHSELIGSSPTFRVVLDKVDRIASANCKALIQGETGTGKEVIARGIHEVGARRKNGLVEPRHEA